MDYHTIEARSKEEYSIEDHASVGVSPYVSPIDTQPSLEEPPAPTSQTTSEESYEVITKTETRSRSTARGLPDSLKPGSPINERQRSRSTGPDDELRLHTRYDSRSASVSRADPPSRTISRSPKAQKQPSADAKARWEMLAALARSSQNNRQGTNADDHERPPASAVEREEIIKRAWSEHEVRSDEHTGSHNGPLDMPAPEEYMAAEHHGQMASHASRESDVRKRLEHDANRSSRGSIDDHRPLPRRKETESEYSSRIHSMLRDADAALQDLPRTPSPRSDEDDPLHDRQYTGSEATSNFHAGFDAMKGVAEHAGQSLSSEAKNEKGELEHHISNAEHGLSQAASKTEINAAQAFKDSMHAAKNIENTAEQATAGLASKAESLAKHGGSNLEHEAVAKEAAVFSDLKRIGQQTKGRIAQAVDESRLPIEGAKVEQGVERAKNLVRQGSRELEQSRLGRKVSQEANKLGDKAKDVKDSLERMKDNEGNALGAGIRAAQQFARRTSGTPVHTPTPSQSQSQQGSPSQHPQAPHTSNMNAGIHMPMGAGQQRPGAQQPMPHPAAAPHQQAAPPHQPSAPHPQAGPHQPPAPHPQGGQHPQNAPRPQPPPQQPAAPRQPMPERRPVPSNPPAAQHPAQHQQPPPQSAQHQAPSRPPAVQAHAQQPARHPQQQQQPRPPQPSPRPQDTQPAAPNHNAPGGPNKPADKPHQPEPRQGMPPAKQPPNTGQQPAQRGPPPPPRNARTPLAPHMQQPAHNMPPQANQPHAQSQQQGGHPGLSNPAAQQQQQQRPMPSQRPGNAGPQGAHQPPNQQPTNSAVPNAGPGSQTQHQPGNPNDRAPAQGFGQQRQDQSRLPPPNARNDQRSAIAGMPASPLHPAAVPQRGGSQYRMGMGQNERSAPQQQQQQQQQQDCGRAPQGQIPRQSNNVPDQREGSDQREPFGRNTQQTQQAPNPSPDMRGKFGEQRDERSMGHEAAQSHFRASSEGEMNLYSSASSEAGGHDEGFTSRQPGDIAAQGMEPQGHFGQQQTFQGQESSTATYEAFLHTFKQQARAYGVGDGTGPASGFLEQMLQLLLKLAEDALPEIRRRLEQNANANANSGTAGPES